MMARQAVILATAEDVDGALWDIREARPTPHGFDVQMGWPHGDIRGRGGSGGPRVVLTAPLAAYLEVMRERPVRIALPIGRGAVKRLRRLLGHHAQIDRAAWWEARADDLAEMTIERFAARHEVSVGAVVQARHALFGPTLRPAGWWRAPDVAALILADRPRVEIADQLGISLGSVGRLRWALASERKGEIATP